MIVAWAALVFDEETVWTDGATESIELESTTEVTIVVWEAAS